MKKSKMYQLAAIAVMNSNSLADLEKLAILKELSEKEETYRYFEAKEEQEKENVHES